MRYLLAALALSFSGSPSSDAVGQNLNWVEVSPAGESFHVSMPTQPSVEKESVGVTTGIRYTAFGSGATYKVWSLTDTHLPPNLGPDEYLDACAELIWEGLFKEARDKLTDSDRRYARMVYVGELPANPLMGREYSIAIGDLVGTTEAYISSDRFYVLLVMGKAGGHWLRQKFLASFAVPQAKPYGDAVTQVADKTIKVAADANRVYSSREVTEKVRLLEKPEPTYTESARKFAVHGTVVLRAVFSKDSEVTNIHVVRKLPHGLTQTAIIAAQRIKFSPAMLDGQPVSMSIELQYNFNLY